MDDVKNVELKMGEALKITKGEKVLFSITMAPEKPPWENDTNITITPGDMHPKDGSYYIIVEGQR